MDNTPTVDQALTDLDTAVSMLALNRVQHVHLVKCLTVLRDAAGPNTVGENPPPLSVVPNDEEE